MIFFILHVSCCCDVKVYYERYIDAMCKFTVSLVSCHVRFESEFVLKGYYFVKGHMRITVSQVCRVSSNDILFLIMSFNLTLNRQCFSLDIKKWCWRQCGQVVRVPDFKFRGRGLTPALTTKLEFFLSRP